MPRRPVPLLPDTGPVRLRHVRAGTSSDAGAVNIDGAYFVPQAGAGVNGEAGFQEGDLERRLGEEGAVTVAFPNVAGGDGVLHRDRFLYFTDDDYHPGDEWLEVYTRDTDLKFVGTPVGGTLSNGVVQLELADALVLLQTTRETAAGVWTHAPRDAFEHYTRRWAMRLAEGFDPPERFFLSFTDVNTSDGEWTHRNVDQPTSAPSSLRMRPTSLTSPSPGQAVLAHRGAPIAHDPTAAWRVEIAFRVGAVVSAWDVMLGVTNDPATLELTHHMHAGSGQKAEISTLQPATKTVASQKPADLGTFVTMAMEKRDRWVFYYLNGELRGVMPALPGTLTLKPFVWAFGTDGTYVLLDHVIVRAARPLLQRSGIGGDLRLPGNASNDAGLQGEYFDDADLWSSLNAVINSDGTAGDGAAGVLPPERVLNPTREPYARRIDATLGFAAGNWQPAGPNGNDRWSARWTGSIYLDLDSYDYAFRTDCDDRMRVWLGRTRNGEQYIDDWPGIDRGAPVTTYGRWVKAGNVAAATGASPSGSTGPLAGQRSGWYPIIVEFSVGIGAAAAKARLEVERSDLVGSWNALGSAPDQIRLSPLGIFRGRVRYDSHYEQLAAIARDFGYQYTVEPRQLESGEFPGRCVPVIRQGRDTDKVVDELEGVEPTVQSKAGEVIDGLIADAAGLATEDNGQLTLEAYDLTRPLTQRLAFLQDYESLADITFRRLVEQRAAAMLALRSSPWEEVAVQVPGRRELRDSFPLTGALAEFDWGVGDAVRLRFPRVRVEDTVPRPITGVKRPFRRAGVGAPALSFRQRSRSMRRQLRDLARSAVSSDRNYQGQYVERTSSMAASPVVATIPDDVARLSLPDNLDDVAECTLVVHSRAGATTTPWNVYVNGALTDPVIGINSARSIDLTPYVRRDGVNRRMYVQLLGGTGTVQYQAVLRLRV